MRLGGQSSAFAFVVRPACRWVGHCRRLARTFCALAMTSPEPTAPSPVMEGRFSAPALRLGRWVPILCSDRMNGIWRRTRSVVAPQSRDVRVLVLNPEP